MNRNSELAFSKEIGNWLKSPGKKTLEELNEVFGERTFAIALLILMIPSALPLPTGGLTHVFAVIGMVVSFEMIVGMKTIWLPNFIKKKQLSAVATDKTIPYITDKIRYLERFSRPRYQILIDNRASSTLFGVIFLIFCTGAGIAPPFSFLDTLPALGVVLLALSIILGDGLVSLIGIFIGSLGIGLLIALGDLVINFFQKFI